MIGTSVFSHQPRRQFVCCLANVLAIICSDLERLDQLQYSAIPEQVVERFAQNDSRGKNRHPDANTDGNARGDRHVTAERGKIYELMLHQHTLRETL